MQQQNFAEGMAAQQEEGPAEEDNPIDGDYPVEA